VVACLAPLIPAGAQEAPAKWGPGCDKALLDGEFSLSKAPEMACTKEKKAFIDKVIAEVKAGYYGTMVTGDTGNPYIDTPEFTAFFLRAFADPGQDLGRHDRRIEGFLSRLASSKEMFKDARLDWDMWRAWLLFENTAYMQHDWVSVSSRQGTEYRVRHELHCARQLLWAYLSLNSAAILKDPQRRAWWLTRLTADLEAPGGRPQRRWFLLLLLSKEDPKREALDRIYVKPAFTKYRSAMRQPHPLDPFLIVTGENPQIPAFGDAVTQIALNSKLSLTVLGIDPAAQPATRVNTISLDDARTPGEESKVIDRESWSAPPEKKPPWVSPFDYEWGVTLFPPHDYHSFVEVQLPEDRTDGVFFFVFNQRLYVWPKAKMDTAVIQMLRTANLVDAAAATAFEKRGFVPLKETLVKESPGK
jgi:hypothetical protein